MHQFVVDKFHSLLQGIVVFGFGGVGNGPLQIVYDGKDIGYHTCTSVQDNICFLLHGALTVVVKLGHLAEQTVLEAEVADLKDRLLRQMAEFDNFRKRTMKEKAEIILNGSAGVVTDILPVIDDLERAIANSAKSEDYDALKEGVELIYNKLMHILEQKGLQKISPKNEPFDTDFHEAIAMIPAPSEDLKGKVLDCAIDGYKLNDKVLRHAKVAVGQ